MKISGNIDEIRFRNEENGYTITVLDVNGDPVIAVGTFPPVSEGEDVEVTGDFVVHHKFGRQFKVTDVRKLAPNTIDGIVRFLGSGIIKGVGPRTALALAAAFGKETLNVIEHYPNRLTVVRGISAAKAMAIHEEYIQNKKMQDAVMYLQAQDIPIGTALKIYRFYGDDTVKIVSENPYRLIEDIDGIGFITADRIATKQGLPKDSPFRMRAGLLHELAVSSEDGNTFLPRDELVIKAAQLLKCEDGGINNEIDSLIIDGKLKRVDIDGLEAIYHRSVFQAERGASAGLIRLISEADRIGYDTQNDITEFERINKVSLHEKQKDAVSSAVTNGVSVITGGPGTGKTTVIKCIIDITEKLGISSMLMAPTGRAAKRLSESTGRDATTIHRALMKDVGQSDYKSAVTPFKCGAVIVDEVSMVDVFLLNLLVRRLASGTRLILVGDKDQLPSVGAGNVLADIIACGLIPVVMLTHIYRQSEQSLIAANAHAVNEGKMPDISSKDKDFFFIKVKSNEQIADTVVDMASRRIPKYLGVEAQKLQVLCPVKNGASGTLALNRRLQEVINPTGTQVQFGDIIYRVGDKVMHIANNYQLSWVRRYPYYETGEGVFNGDTGIIIDVKTDSGEITVLLDDGRTVMYPADVRNQLMPAYAVTVHKSQGSEYVGVIMPITGGSPMIMTRNLLYTAITRAKKFVALVGDEYYLKRMIDNNYIAKRYSGMKSFLVELYGDNNLLYGDTL
ncbi:MAG: ATP-dependent RecD-like DNA helicase [Clostridiales bacterium]|nr:ATP-dependent RecD-like DNA helicase [Clostridiales bacterium]